MSEARGTAQHSNRRASFVAVASHDRSSTGIPANKVLRIPEASDDNVHRVHEDSTGSRQDRPAALSLSLPFASFNDPVR